MEISYDSDREYFEERNHDKKIPMKNILWKESKYRTLKYNATFKQFLKYSYHSYTKVNF